MIEVLGIVASIIGIAGAIWALMRYLLRHRLRKEESYREVLAMVDEHYAKWKKGPYESRGGSLISREKFDKVNRFRDRLRKLDEEKLAFLLRCAIQNGMSGEWGDWLILNKANINTLPTLTRALKGEAGWRPIWRSAYILEKTCGRNMDSILEKLSREERSNATIASTIDVIVEQGTKKYLRGLSMSGSPDMKKKAEMVLQEIECFSAQTNQYAEHVRRQGATAVSKPEHLGPTCEPGAGS